MSDTSIYNALYSEISPYKTWESDLMKIYLCVYTRLTELFLGAVRLFTVALSAGCVLNWNTLLIQGGRILHPLRLRVHTLMFLTLCVHRVFEATIDGNGHGSINTIPRHSGDSETLFAYYNKGCPFAYTLYHVRSITFCYWVYFKRRNHRQARHRMGHTQSYGNL